MALAFIRKEFSCADLFLYKIACSGKDHNNVVILNIPLKKRNKKRGALIATSLWLPLQLMVAAFFIILFCGIPLPNN